MRKNGREHAYDNRPRSSLLPAARQIKSKLYLYFKCDPGSLDKARSEDSYKMSSAQSSNNPEPGAMSGLNALQLVKGLFLRIFTERISGLDEDYDPELSTNPLSDEQIEEMRNNLANFLSFEENEETTVFNELSNTAKEYVENTVFSYVTDNISHGHFRRTFARVVRVLWQIRFYLETILTEFPFAATWGVTISNDCISRIYAQYGPQLVSAILTRMRERRVQNIDSQVEMYSIFEIAKHFKDFDDDVWKNPYVQNILDDTSMFLENFDLQPPGVDQFETLASTRAEKEVTLVSSFGFGRRTRKEAIKQVYTAFSQKFEELVNDNPQESLRNHLRKCIRSTPFEQADADRFFKVLSVYGHGSMWSIKKDELQDEIVERGSRMIQVQTFGVLGNNWDMASLTVAVQKLSEYEKSVRDVFQMPTNRLPGLRQMLNNVLKSLFQTMFRSEVGLKPPQEFLADFVEHIAMKTDETRGWQRTQLGHLQRIIKHLSDKDIFLSHIERRIRAHNPRNLERRNRTFLQALEAISRVTSVSPELITSVRRACHPRLSARQWAQTRPDVIYTQYTMQTAPPDNDAPLLTDMDVDALMLYTVSITKFCGQRHNANIRMSKMQLEVFSFLLQFGKSSKDTIRELIARIGVFSNIVMVDLTADMVLESLEDVGLISLDGDFVDLESPTLTKPYMEAGPVDPDLEPAATNIIFSIDNAIVEYLEERIQCTSQELFEHLFDLRTASSYGLVRSRILKLSLRKFIAIEGLNISFIPFAPEEA